MPLLQINAGPDRPGIPVPAGAAAPPRQTLNRTLRAALAGDGPVIIMAHGFKFSPGHAHACPHRHILSLDPPGECRKALSWPRELGFGTGSATEGLGIAFGWPARGSIWHAYRQAEAAGVALARLVTEIRDVAPARPVHALAHSLGARVVLSALPHLAAGSLDRIIMLAAAEYGHHAAAALDSPAGRTAEAISITSRENDLFDFMLERLIAPPARGDRVLSQALPRRPNTLTVQMDNPATLAALRSAGFDIAPPAARICHWSSYLRPGVFGFYRSLIRRRETLPLARLHAALPERPDPRWSRFVTAPRLPRFSPVGRRASS